jgi:hypothetical protein
MACLAYAICSQGCGEDIDGFKQADRFFVGLR